LDRTLLAELAQKFLAGTATEQENALLHQWFDTADKEEIELVFLPKRETEDEVRTRIFAGLQLAIGQEQISREPIEAAPVERGLPGQALIEPELPGQTLIEPGLPGQAPVEQPFVELKPYNAPRRIGRYFRWMAAASIFLAVGISGLYHWNARRSRQASGAPIAGASRRDLLPGGNKATLLLGDGSVVNLGAAQNGVIKRVAGTSIDKHEGQLVYRLSADAGAGDGAGRPNVNIAPEANTIETPRGGEYQVVLSDGTKVWLNAASSLTYPTAFTGQDRQVQLKGEAYFEVAENKDKPFVVTMGEMRVNVLGTHFNVMAYDDENTIKTTLLEGAVKVSKGQASNLLRPGQEAALDKSSGSLRSRDVDVDEAIAWKNGVFQFGGVSIEAVMREIARWYDVEVEYQGRVTNQHFRGTISRSVDASEVFKMLELTGAVNFTIEGKKIIVRP
jgi:ferric-dicitrate binding protein FerR (iron transport regulator)